MTLNDQATREVLAVLDRYVEYYNAKDKAKVLSLFSKIVSGFGTGKDEVVRNSNQMKKQIDIDLGPVNAIRLSIDVLSIGSEMPVAWITGLCTFTGSMGGKPIYMDGRMTAVLKNHGGRWLFEQIHFSVPDA